MATRALKGIDLMIERYDPGSDEEDEPELEPEMDITASPPAGATPAPTPASAAPKSKDHVLNTPEGVATYIKFALEPHGSTRIFHWKVWNGENDKKGFLLSPLIAYTYAYHLERLAAIPGGYEKSKAHAVGALLLSVQAVQRALELWKTGEYVNQNRKADQ
ncbi:hypothetical protein B0H10DRAFT_754006 [Mycena sp. CBHHK59/15]|nr:hypothetical protein B0H10DRAFT_754006 [Mycena sp. CBHHK59/15]